MNSLRIRGMALVIIGAVLWGVSGTVVQYLLQYEFTVEWLIVIRLLVAGVILLSMARIKEGEIFHIWRNKKDAVGLIIFSILGLLSLQYTFFVAIKHSNAATAAILQYLAPALLVCYVAIIRKEWPILKEILAIIVAVLGTFLLVTGGNFKSLSISKLALFWGLSSAVALVVYTLQPLRLLAKYDSFLIIGWGMFIGGTVFVLFNKPWVGVGEFTYKTVFAVCFIIIFGTILSYYLYAESLKYISGSDASILVSMEPLSAAIVSILWLNVKFGIVEWIGAMSIIMAVIILSVAKKDTESKQSVSQHS